MRLPSVPGTFYQPCNHNRRIIQGLSAHRAEVRGCRSRPDGAPLLGRHLYEFASWTGGGKRNGRGQSMIERAGVTDNDSMSSSPPDCLAPCSHEAVWGRGADSRLRAGLGASRGPSSWLDLWDAGSAGDGMAASLASFEAWLPCTRASRSAVAFCNANRGAGAPAWSRVPGCKVSYEVR